VGSLSGQLLVAGPALWDPSFRRTVVLLGHHDDEGAVGVVLNRESEVSVLEAAPSLAPIAGFDARLFLGGPVQREAAVVVADFEQPDRAGLLAVGSIGFLAGEDPDAVGGISRARVFAGYAGWGPGQLEAEIEEDSWILEPARALDVFTDRPDRLWSDVLRRKGADYEIMALMPDDPTLN